MKEAAVVQAAEEVATEKMAEQYAEEVRFKDLIKSSSLSTDPKPFRHPNWSTQLKSYHFELLDIEEIETALEG